MEGVTHGASEVALAHGGLMSALPGPGRVVGSPEHVGGGRQPLQVLDAERSGAVGDIELLVGVGPGLGAKARRPRSSGSALSWLDPSPSLYARRHRGPAAERDLPG